MSNLYLLASNVLATLPGQVLEEKFVNQCEKYTKLKCVTGF
jgi:hypothetical protein